MKNKNKGFTLIELLIVIGIIAILAVAVIVAVNPGQQFKQARNSTRKSHLSSVATAVYSFSVQNRGNFPDCLDDEFTAFGLIDDCTPLDGGDGVTFEALLTPNFMNQLPTDPDGTSHYQIRVIVGSLELNSTSIEFDDVIVQ